MNNVAFDVTLKEYLKEITEASLLNAEEERSLGKLISEENDQWAREQLVRSNLRLVVCIAKKYGGRGMGLDDLIEEGNLGLIKAVDCFDPYRGVRFSTHAAWWIKQSIKRALLENVQPVHIPTYMVMLINQWRRIACEMGGLNKTLSIEEMADIMRLPLRKARAIHHIVETLSSVKSFSGGAMESDEDQMLKVILEDPNACKPEDVLSAIEEKAKILRLLNEIDSREANILKQHFGLDGNTPMSLKEIAKKLSLTQERIRQIRRDTLTKLYKKW